MLILCKSDGNLNGNQMLAKRKMKRFTESSTAFLNRNEPVSGDVNLLSGIWEATFYTRNTVECFDR